MNTRRRHGPSSTEQGVYLGPTQTQVLTSKSLPSVPVASGPVPPFQEEIMSCRDRTQEFVAACKSMQSRQNGLQVNKPLLNAVRQRSEFTTMAKRIGKDLSNTFSKLEKLTILAKRKSLFDDKAVEIEELTYIIKQDINSLNKQIAQLQDFVRTKESQNGRHLQTHSNTIVVSLQSRLASMSNDFKSVLEVRTENLKMQKNRREQFSHATVSSLPPSAANGYGGSVLLQDDARRSGDIAIDMDTKTSQQLQLIDDQILKYFQSVASNRWLMVKIFLILAVFFTSLCPPCRIDANVEDTELNVAAAHTEILKYFQSVASNRWLMVKIFLILAVFFIVFVVFLA
ncbi:syntaxin-5-like isoform X1 [Chiloscyllium plagiosum]|uniref:syntaxin-5-like isoform X1 n=1 Tax=Chiloscyllium plagiosum TaxID=36176 RepID=UPI001CB7B062|nr:syntaxin-5-like isoform X1 [Chiloscyllium plagiosum]